MNERLIKIVWCVCIMLTILTSGWPIFNNDYMIIIWVWSAISSVILPYVILANASHVDSDFQISCAIIAALCVLFVIVSIMVIAKGHLDKINDDFITLAKCMLCMLLPIGVITIRIATWKPKK